MRIDLRKQNYINKTPTYTYLKFRSENISVLLRSEQEYNKYIFTKYALIDCFIDANTKLIYLY